MYELRFEIGKVQEKKSNLTSETFESMKAIKLYAWDNHFHREIVKLMEKEKEIDD